MTDELTADERAELDSLRAEKATPKQTLKEQAAEEEAAEAAKPTHWLHLANGDVVESRGTSTLHYGVPVLNSSAIVDLTDYENSQKENK